MITYSQFKSSVFEWRIMRAENDGVPKHDVVVGGGATDASRGILLKRENNIISSQFDRFWKSKTGLHNFQCKVPFKFLNLEKPSVFLRTLKWLKHSMANLSHTSM